MAIREVALVACGVVLGVGVTSALTSPAPGETFPVVFRGTTQGVSASGDAVAFYPNQGYTDVFDAFPAFAVSGENRSNESLHATCLAPGRAEQDVVFAVVNTGEYALAWYACFNKGVLRS